jgi:hypothetical protein
MIGIFGAGAMRGSLSSADDTKTGCGRHAR